MVALGSLVTNTHTQAPSAMPHPGSPPLPLSSSPPCDHEEQPEDQIGEGTSATSEEKSPQTAGAPAGSMAMDVVGAKEANQANGKPDEPLEQKEAPMDEAGESPGSAHTYGRARRVRRF